MAKLGGKKPMDGSGCGGGRGDDGGQPRSAIDALLGENPTDFQLKLLKLAREFHWDENDPGFAVPLATTQIERVMKDYPEQVSAQLAQLAQRQQQTWERMKAAMDVTAFRAEQATGQLAQRLVETKGLVDLDIAQLGSSMQAERMALAEAMQAEREALRTEFEQEREALHGEAIAERKAVVALLEQERQQALTLLAGERREMATLAKQLSEQLRQETNTQTQAIIAEGVVAARRRADEQVKQIVKAVRGKHYLEVGLYAIAVAGLLIATSWSMAWMTRGRVENNSRWGDIERWNQDHLQACIEAQQTTCNFHIEVPDHPVEQ